MSAATKVSRRDFVDSAPALERLQQLLDTGALLKHLAETVGIPRATLGRLRGYPKSPPPRTIHPETSAAVLAVEPWMVGPRPRTPADEVMWLLHAGRSVEDVAASEKIKVGSVLTTLRRRALAGGPDSADARLRRRILAERAEQAYDRARRNRRAS